MLKNYFRISLFLALFSSFYLSAQDCGKLYLLNAQNGNVYDISALNGTLPSAFTNLNTNARSNLAVGSNPSNATQTVFTSSNTNAGSAVYVANSAIATTLPIGVGGLTANPNAGNTRGYVYGISSDKRLVKVSPAPASTLGLITGDATWTSGTVASDAFFDNTGKMIVAVTSTTGTKSLYSINIAALTATSYLGLSGVLPTNFQGLSYYNSKIYAVEGYTSGFFIQRFNARIYEINSNTGVSIVKTTYNLNSGFLNVNSDELDLASCATFIPPTTPTCNELFGVNEDSIYRINLNNLTTTMVANGFPADHRNMAYGPVSPAGLSNQFVVSMNGGGGGGVDNIFKGTATTSLTTLTNSGHRWETGGNSNGPVGIGTDPTTGIVYGINNKRLSRYLGTGNASALSTITGDTTWTAGTTLNDIAVDNGSNLYCMINIGSTNVWLYRVNSATSAATPVVKVSGVYPDGTAGTGGTENGNGLAYLGDYFYYSRFSTASNTTTIWRLNATTGVSSLVGAIGNMQMGDLGSCATVTNVPATFAFNCSVTEPAELTGAQLIANGNVQANVLRVPISNAVNGLAGFTLTGSGITTTPTPYIAFVAQGALFVDIPFTYNGSGTAGPKNIVVTSTTVAGSCTATTAVLAGTCFDDALSGTGEDTKHGITLLKRAGSQNNNWPVSRKGAFTVLESNTKGFVITRMTTSQIAAIASPLDGMMVFDTDVKCLKIYTVNDSSPTLSTWSCYLTPDCL